MTPELILIPDQVGVFTKISPAQFRAVARRAQGFTTAEAALEVGITRKTMSSYLDTARHRLGMDTTQEVIWAYYRLYAPGLLVHDAGQVSP